eukprot:SAG25_NODE_4817_length_745_cov_1.591331_1_plen_34_part_10
MYTRVHSAAHARNSRQMPAAAADTAVTCTFAPFP